MYKIEKMYGISLYGMSFLLTMRNNILFCFRNGALAEGTSVYKLP